MREQQKVEILFNTSFKMEHLVKAQSALTDWLAYERSLERSKDLPTKYHKDVATVMSDMVGYFIEGGSEGEITVLKFHINQVFQSLEAFLLSREQCDSALEGLAAMVGTPQESHLLTTKELSNGN